VMLRHLFSVAFLISFATACTHVGTSSGTGGRHAYTHPHELRMADISDVTTLNPMLSADLTVSWVAELTMAFLLRWDQQNRPMPELALAVPSLSNGGISPDGKTITYHLRRGVRWSDGTPFTADDVVFTTRLVLDSKTNVVTRDGWDRITKIDEPDKYTIVYHMREAYSPSIATFFTASQYAILPKHLLEHTANINTDPYNELPIGIGPFKYVRWQRGDRIEFVANPLYWRGRPKLDRIVYRIIPNRDTIVSALQTGDVDLWPNAAPAYFLRLRNLQGYVVLRTPSYAYGHLDFNVTHSVVRDVAVRRALLLGWDRSQQREKISHGVGILQDAVVSPASPFYDRSLGFTSYNPAKANAVLDAAGWKRGPDGIRAKNGVRLNLAVVSNAGSPDTDQRIELLRANWRQIGVSLIRKNVSPALLLAPYAQGGIIFTGNFDVVFFAWFADPSGSLVPEYSCLQIPPQGENDLRWCDPVAQRAMVDFMHTFDFARQKRDNDIVQERVVDQVPTIVSAIQEELFASNSDLKNFHPNQVSFFDNMMNVDI